MPRKPKTRPPYLMVSPPTWDLARADYLGGMTAKAVADKHHIGLHNLRQTMARNGWTKRALADARARAGPGGPPVTVPAAPAAAAGVDDSTDLLEAVLRRARTVLTAGRGGEASALIKATREYVILQQDVADARTAVADGVAMWDAAQPARAGEATEMLMLQTLHGRWSKLTPEEQVERLDPHGRKGFRAWLDSLRPEGAVAGRKGWR